MFSYLISKYRFKLDFIDTYFGTADWDIAFLIYEMFSIIVAIPFSIWAIVRISKSMTTKRRKVIVSLATAVLQPSASLFVAFSLFLIVAILFKYEGDITGPLVVTILTGESITFLFICKVFGLTGKNQSVKKQRSNLVNLSRDEEKSGYPQSPK